MKKHIFEISRKSQERPVYDMVGKVSDFLESPIKGSDMLRIENAIYRTLNVYKKLAPCIKVRRGNSLMKAEVHVIYLDSRDPNLPIIIETALGRGGFHIEGQEDYEIGIDRGWGD